MRRFRRGVKGQLTRLARTNPKVPGLPAHGASRRRAATRPEGPLSFVRPLSREMLNLMVVQESYRADHGSYADAADSLRVGLEGGARLFLSFGDHRHWRGGGA